MALPIPNLDVKRFEEIVAEAYKYIPLYAPSWTDHNLSDPGITLVDLFAWLTEMQLYNLDVVTDQHLLKYLALLGIKPRPAKPARVDIHLSEQEGGAAGFVAVPVGTRVKSSFWVSGVPIEFETTGTVEFLPLTIAKVLSYRDYALNDISGFNEKNENYFHPFGETPKAGDTLYLGLDSGKSAAELDGKTVRLALYPYEEDLPPLGAGRDDGSGEVETVIVEPPAEVAWEYYQAGIVGGDTWEPLVVASDHNHIPVLLRQGILAFDFPEDASTQVPPEIAQQVVPPLPPYWIRCRLTSSSYEIPPRLKRVLTNTVAAVEGRSRKEEAEGTGLPYQVIRVEHYPIVPGSQVVVVGGTEWQQKDDFDASGPDAGHYLVEPGTGQIYFGDGINGAVPALDEEIEIAYRSTAGLQGNIGAGILTEIGIVELRADNPFPSFGSLPEETVDQAFERFKIDLKVPYTAITAGDYEVLARAVPGLRVARAKAVLDPDHENRVIIAAVPYSFNEKPLPGPGFKDAVCRFLDTRRPLTTAIRVVDPDYVQVSVDCEIRISAGYDPVQVADAAETALDDFLSPLDLDDETGGRPFGRPVYRAEVIELLEGVEGVDCVVALTLAGSGGYFNLRQGNIHIRDLGLVYPGNHNIEIVEFYDDCRGG